MTTTIAAPSFTGQIGFARIDITPEIGIYSKNWGASTKSILTKVHNPLFINTISFNSNGNLFLMSAFDLGGFSNEEEFHPRGLLPFLADKYQIPESNILLHCVHTHSGPSLNTTIEDPGGEKILPFLKTMKEKLIKSMDDAIACQKEATIEWESGISPLATNRDLIDFDKDRVITGFNPQIEPDQTVMVGRVTDEKELPIVNIVHYACHPTTLAWENEHLSADYVGSMRLKMEEQTNTPCMFLLGATGDQAPKNQYKGNIDWADRNGNILAYSSLGVLESMCQPNHELTYTGVVESGAPLAVWDQQPGKSSNQATSLKVDIKLKVKSEYPKLKDLQEQLKDTDDHFMQTRIKRKISWRKQIGDEEMISNPVWLWKLGNIFFVGVPNEAYSLLQKSLRKDFPDYAIIPMNITNGCQSYLPDQDQFHKDSYAVWVSIFEKGSLETFYAAAKNGIQQLIDSENN
ncbi:MAG: hypothetical protein COA79_21420 [Planctomycetota bacterium]|nr:MAG: hypothetical protein COA79_21420 [Planctomycetota bacterium]